MRFNTLLLALLCPVLALCQSTLTVVVEYTRTPAPNTTLKVVVCDNLNSFESEEGALVLKVDAQAPVTRVEIPDMKPGDYGIKVYIDQNGNGKLDTGWNNTPTEPYGFSNNAGRITGIPTFDMAAFNVHEGMNVHRILLK